MSDFNPCAVIPTYNNSNTIRKVVAEVREHLPVIVVDDGGDESSAQVLRVLDQEGLAQVHRLDKNGGKGMAVKTGFELARDRGFSHVLQVDADGQHNLHDIVRFISTANEHPDKLILGCPCFDGTAPKARRFARKITTFFTHLETFSSVIVDPMCGFRVYPLVDALPVASRCGTRMDFDIEIAVRMVWRGCGVQNLSTKVHYPKDGVSHFRMFRDNVGISWMHSRLVTEGIIRKIGQLLGVRT